MAMASGQDLGTAVIVQFAYGDDFDRERVAKVADEAKSMFVGMPGVQMKAFTVDDDGRRATNFYIWDSADQARAFFNPKLTEMVTGLYGVAPTITYGDVLAVVDNKNG